MKKKAKISSRTRRVFYKLIGASRTKVHLTRYLVKKFNKKAFSFPVDTANVQEMLIVLPEHPLEVLYQLKNILSIRSIFRNTHITVFCINSCASFISMIPDISIVEYQKAELSDFSIEFGEYVTHFKNQFEICILLDRNPQISILSFVGLTNASIRAGYYEAGGYPFLNLKTRQAETGGYLSDKNCLMAELFGVQTQFLKMSVAKKTLDEVGLLLKECRISQDRGLLVVDICFFLKSFGKQWLEQFLTILQKNYSNTIIGYLSEELSGQDSEWLRENRIACILELSTPRIAAIIYCSDLIIAGNTTFYGLATVLNKPSIGFFTSKDYSSYCPDTDILTGVIYEKLPDDDCIKKVINSIHALAGKNG